MKVILLSSILCFIAISGFMQAPPAGYFGGIHDATPYIRDEMSPEQRALINQAINSNIQMLEKKGITPQSMMRRSPQETKFGFPLRQAAGFNDHGFYGISNFVDVDPTSGSKDFNCGARTYNGHMGTDFFTAPFWWKKMDENAVEVIAAADGIIVAKQASKADRVCANCPTGAPASCYEWNAIYMQHADGSIAMYGHMKQNSLTTKGIGDAVAKGEFLGIVGSSGNSSGPHLHFEVWKDNSFTELLLPWAGTCNPDGNASMWDNQEPYYSNKIIHVMTSDAVPEMDQCYDGAPEVTHEKKIFVRGEGSVYFTNYVRDNRPGGPLYKLWVFNPDGSTKWNWTLSHFNAIYGMAWFYYYYPDSNFPESGEYTFRLAYGLDTVDVKFQFVSPAPLDLVSFNAKSNFNHVALQWQTENEQNSSHFEIERSTDALNFVNTGQVSSTGNGKTGINQYSFLDESPEPGINYYRLKMVDTDGKFKYSHTEKVSFDGNLPVKMYPNPASNKIVLQNVKQYNTVSISNMSGRRLLHKIVVGNECAVDISALPDGVYVVQLAGDGKEQKLKLMKRKQ